MLDFVQVPQKNGSRLIRPERPSLKFKREVSDDDLNLPGLQRSGNEGADGKKNQG
jgi:hypothetical protein